MFPEKLELLASSEVRRKWIKDSFEKVCDEEKSEKVDKIEHMQNSEWKKYGEEKDIKIEKIPKLIQILEQIEKIPKQIIEKIPKQIQKNKWKKRRLIEEEVFVFEQRNRFNNEPTGYWKVLKKRLVRYNNDEFLLIESEKYYTQGENR